MSDQDMGGQDIAIRTSANRAPTTGRPRGGRGSGSRTSTRLHDQRRRLAQLPAGRRRARTLDRRKYIFYYFLIAIYLAAPWITIGGHPRALVDIPARSAYLLGATFTNQDFHLFFFLYRRRHRPVRGDLAVRARLVRVRLPADRVHGGRVPADRAAPRGRPRHAPEAQPRRAAADAVWRKTVKHAAFLFLSWNFAIAFMCYFIPTRDDGAVIPFLAARPPTALVWSLFWTGLLYFDYSWFREQTCLIICPYGRLQSTLVDYDTIIIGYDGSAASRATRRGHGRRLHRLPALRRRLPDGHRHPQRPADGVHRLHQLHRRLRRDHGQDRQAARAWCGSTPRAASRPAASRAAAAALLRLRGAHLRAADRCSCCAAGAREPFQVDGAAVAGPAVHDRERRHPQPLHAPPAEQGPTGRGVYTLGAAPAAGGPGGPRRR